MSRGRSIPTRGNIVDIAILNCVTDAQTRIRASDTQTTHKMVGGVTLVGGNGSELTRLPGGAELNILPANGTFQFKRNHFAVLILSSR